jgi:hypothetical protein
MSETKARERAKHTPGPWKIERNCLHEPVIEAVDGALVAICRKGQLADSRLIAAAPDLIAALRVLVDHAQETYPHFEDERGKRDIALSLAAIAKAEGREE